MATVVTERYLQRKGFELDRAQVYVMPENWMQRVTKEGKPEGILMQIVYPTSIRTTINPSITHSLLLLNPADPRNLGSLMRSALALGWDQVVVYGKQACDPLHVESVRCSKGAVLKLGVVVKISDEEHLISLFSHDTDVFIAEPSNNKNKATPSNLTAKRRLLILGSESHGLQAVPRALRLRAHPTPILTSASMPFLSVSSAGAILMHALKTAVIS